MPVYQDFDLQRIIDRTYEDLERSYCGTPCWIWKGSIKKNGYGQIWHNGTNWSTHRYSYCCVNPDLDQDDLVRHMCHNRACCNPDHLKAGTNVDNYRDSKESYRTMDLKKRKAIIIEGRHFESRGAAADSTGIDPGSLARYDRNGIFDSVAYRESCLRLNRVPRI